MASLIDTKVLIMRSNEFFIKFMGSIIKRALVEEEGKFINVNFEELVEYEPSFADALMDSPTEVLGIMEQSLKTIATNEMGDDYKDFLSIRIFNTPDSLMISEIRQEHIGKLLVFNGYVKSKTTVFSTLKRLDYLCTNPSCNFSQDIIRVPQFYHDKQERVLKACPKCKSGVELLNRHLVDTQIVMLEEDSAELINPTQKVQSKECVLFGGLSSYDEDTTLELSSNIKVTGIVREKRIKPNVFDYYIEVKHIEKENIEVQMKIDKVEADEILKFSKREDVKDILINNFVPEVWGREMIKKGLIFQLFGCADKEKARDNINILVVGDPSTGKSVLSKNTIDYHPRGLYTSGESTSGVGLIGAVVQDPFLKRFTVEAGFLQRANRGLAVVDEVDKMNKTELDKFNTVLESQKIIHNKAGLFEETNVKEDVLCCANPKFGHFVDEKSIASQIEFTSYFLTRFDLIFVIKDDTDENEMNYILDTMIDNGMNESETKLDISKDFFKKYVYYAKQNIMPKFTPDSREYLKKFFLQLKPLLKLSPRQFGALTRLCEASARMRLSKQISKEDVKEVCDLFAYSVEPILKECGDLSSLHASPMLKKHFEGLSYESFDVLTAKSSKRTIARTLMNAFNYYKETEIYSITLEQIEEYPSFKDPIILDKVMNLISEYKQNSEIWEPTKNTLKLVGNQPLTLPK